MKGQSVGDSTESRIVVLPFYHLTEARTTTTAGNGGRDFVPFHSRSLLSELGRVYLK